MQLTEIISIRTHRHGSVEVITGAAKSEIFAVHASYDGPGWTVTHRRTGCAVFANIHSQTLASVLMRVLEYVSIDWKTTSRIREEHLSRMPAELRAWFHSWRAR